MSGAIGDVPMNLLSIQSHVAYGHVGNAAAVFPLQRLGIGVWPVHTVQLSNHTGHETARGQTFDAALIREVVHGIGERGAFARCDGVLSGYMGSAEIGAAILDAVDRVKRANTRARYCCDPVMGDAGRVYVRPGVPEFLRERAVPAADLVTPNQFELEMLTGLSSRTHAEAARASGAIRALGPETVLITSVHAEETPNDAIDLMASGRDGRFLLRTPCLSTAVHGAGDLVAALFFAHLLRTGSTAEALSLAASSVFGVLRRTADADAGEMLLVEAQEEFVEPSRMFQAQAI